MSSITCFLNKCFFFILFMSQTVGLYISENLTYTLDYSGSFIIYAVRLLLSRNFALSHEVNNHNQLNFPVCDFEGNNCSDAKSLV